jgi:hypothetical protein
MQEKKVSMDDAFKIWWFMAWRTTLTSIGTFFILSIIFTFIGVTESTKPLISTICCIVSLLISVFYIKLAINRDYKNFRLSATLLNNEQNHGEQSNQQ